jgi:hypothetical protein
MRKPIAPQSLSLNADVLPSLRSLRRSGVNAEFKSRFADADDWMMSSK